MEIECIGSDTGRDKVETIKIQVLLVEAHGGWNVLDYVLDRAQKYVRQLCRVVTKLRRM